mmetsp:Transcript_13734/g.26345  ORF Transcript_13734/g.26345 Transcript_13734/m.26345 type:complete len:315 (-) Transcript_13734:1832-2776(-)
MWPSDSSRLMFQRHVGLPSTRGTSVASHPHLASLLAETCMRKPSGTVKLWLPRMVTLDASNSELPSSRTRIASLRATWFLQYTFSLQDQSQPSFLTRTFTSRHRPHLSLYCRVGSGPSDMWPMTSSAWISRLPSTTTSCSASSASSSASSAPFMRRPPWIFCLVTRHSGPSAGCIHARNDGPLERYSSPIRISGTRMPQLASSDPAFFWSVRNDPSGVWPSLVLPGASFFLAEEVTLLRMLYDTKVLRLSHCDADSRRSCSSIRLSATLCMLHSRRHTCSAPAATALVRFTSIPGSAARPSLCCSARSSGSRPR